MEAPNAFRNLPEVTQLSKSIELAFSSSQPRSAQVYFLWTKPEAADVQVAIPLPIKVPIPARESGRQAAITRDAALGKSALGLGTAQPRERTLTWTLER